MKSIQIRMPDGCVIRMKSGVTLMQAIAYLEKNGLELTGRFIENHHIARRITAPQVVH